MLIKESTLRRIIREEARRALREAAPVPTAGGGQAAPVAGIPVAAGAADGPVAPNVVPDATKKFNEAAEAFKSTINQLVINTPPPSNSYPSLRTLITFVGVPMPGGSPQPAFNDQKVQRFVKVVNSMNAAVTSSAAKDPTSLALILLAAGELASAGEDPSQYQLDPTYAISHLVPKFDPKPDDMASWTQSKTITTNKEADSFAKTVATFASRIVSQFNQLFSATNEYVAANKQTTVAVVPEAPPFPYTVAKGDTVSAIAQRFYGIKPSRSAMPIYQGLVGQGKDPNVIIPGQKLFLRPIMKVGNQTYNLNGKAAPAAGASGTLG